MRKNEPAVVAGLASTMLLFATHASAHAFLVSSTPAAGAVVRSARELRLSFDDNLSPRSRVVVQNAAGAKFGGATALDPKDPSVLVLDLSRPLPPGRYTVHWYAVTRGQGHKTDDDFVFTVAP